MLVTRRPAWAFSLATATQVLSKHFGTATLEGFGFEHERDALALRAAGAILDYLNETQSSSLAHLDRLLPYQTGTTLEIDESTRRSLEITARCARAARRIALGGARSHGDGDGFATAWPIGWQIRWPRLQRSTSGSMRWPNWSPIAG